MPTVDVVHSAADRAFVENSLLPPLAALGVDRWVSHPPGAAQPIRAAADSVAVLVVVSAAGDPPPPNVAPGSAAPLVVFVHQRAPGARATESGGTRPSIVWTPDVSDRGLPAPWRQLASLLRATGASAVTGSGEGAAVPWSEAIFSRFLADAAGESDINRVSALVTTVTRHLANRPRPYPDDAAAADLAVLRRTRLFAPMRQYAQALLAAGTVDFTVRRQYAQALIELGALEGARGVLEAILAEVPDGHTERFEARGLIGRVFKQQYVNAPQAPRAARRLLLAIDAYGSVFDEDPAQIWHGVNAASLIQRAIRDRVAGVDPERARRIAVSVLDTLAARRTRAGAGRLVVWDCASEVEARLALDDIAGGAAALDAYLTHPDMHAFEVSSTYRQFDQVLQLGLDPVRRPLLDALWAAVVRHRTRGVAGTAPQRMLLRVSDPEWSADIPDLKVHTRLGTVLSISGTEQTLKALMNDPRVISVEESRPAGLAECVRSLPFIKVAASYASAAGPYAEKGGGALVAVVDDGIDVLHRAFLDGRGTSRIVGIWDQTDAAGPPPPGFEFGTFHGHEAIARYVAAHNVPDGLGRNDGGRGAPGGHGTHVASIAAGAPAPGFPGGVAPEARLLIVVSGGSQPTGYSDAHLAALAFIEQTAAGLGLPVVVNVSQGMNAGAHDGQSALEVAFNDFSRGGRTPGRVIVKSAGNEGSRNGHARLSMLPRGAVRLRWMCQPDPLRGTLRLELWWSSANTFRFQLRAPSGQRSDAIDEQHPQQSGRLGMGAPFAMTFVRRHIDNGDSLLAVEIGDGVAMVAPGEWTLEITSVDLRAAGVIHAWLERGSPPAQFVNASQDMTLSIPGTAQHVITVGAVDAADPIFAGDFSSAGPTRDGREKPDVAAPGVNVQAARGGTTEGVVAMSGTSMAAPHVAGAIALVLSRAATCGAPWPTSTQLLAVMRQNTVNYSGFWSDVQGYGVIDVAALLAAF